MPSVCQHSFGVPSLFLASSSDWKKVHLDRLLRFQIRWTKNEKKINQLDKKTVHQDK